MAANPPTKMACRTTLTEMLSTVCQVFQESMVRKTFYIFNFCELNFVILLGCNYAYNDVELISEQRCLDDKKTIRYLNEIESKEKTSCNSFNLCIKIIQFILQMIRSGV